MSVPYALYSTDIAATLTPATASPAPATLIVFDNHIDDASYSPARRVKRGSVIQTGAGAVVHDMGVVVQDGRISAAGTVEDGTWISTATRDKLQAAYEGSAQWFWTDGVRVWRVQFLPGDDAAFESTMSLFWKHSTGDEFWSWSMVLMVLAEVTP